MNTRVAVLGMGYWGKNLVRNFHSLGALHTVCDADPDREATVREQYPDVQFTIDIRNVLGNDEIQAVAVSTPAATHHDVVRTALEAGKDVFVEKPLALTEQEGRELVEYANANGRMLMIGHILHYHPAVRRLKELVRSGELGRLQYIYSNRLSIGKIRTEENILWSFAPHDISVILSLLNVEPEYVSCHGKAHLTHDVADSTLSVFSFPNNVQAHIHVSWLHPFKEQRLVVVGSEKMAVFEDTAADKLVVYPHKVKWENQMPTAVKAEREVVDIAQEEPLKNECQAFLDAVESREAPVTDGREGLTVLKMLNLCQDSLEANGKTIQVNGAPAGEEKKWFAHPTAVVDEPVEIGEGTKIWHFGHVMKNVTIGKKCVFGQNCNIDSNVVIGNNVKVQNNVSLYTGLVIEDDVFLGPSCVLTNVTNPRSQVNRHKLYEKTLLRRGCSIGANATVVCGIEIGRYAFVGAGAVVTADVPDYALMLGVPAKQAGWVSRHGLPLRNPDKDGIYTCPESGLRYKEENGRLRCLDIGEDDPLPEKLRVGEQFYDDIVHGKRLK